ncbi:hypothetical protein [Rhodovulum sulfidophilum]|nr:hypothetical protein [Rhodovulum sulfidophilum]
MARRDSNLHASSYRARRRMTRDLLRAAIGKNDARASDEAAAPG